MQIIKVASVQCKDLLPGKTCKRIYMCAHAVCSLDCEPEWAMRVY